MIFDPPLVRGVLIQRYKRFLADIVLDTGETITAHVANPGAMLGLTAPGSAVWLSKSPDPKRKLAYSWELIEVRGEETGEASVVGLNTMHPNRLVAEALAAGAISELAGYDSVRREVKYSHNSRVDFLLQSEGRANCWLEVKGQLAETQPSKRCWVEVKNCHYVVEPGLAEFPDCVAARSTKHLGDLEEMVRQGDRAVVLFIVQREDCGRFRASKDKDPKFAAALDRASAAGVEMLAYSCQMTSASITIAKRIQWERV